MTCETGLGEWIDFRRLKWRVGKGNRVTSDSVSSACKRETTLRAGLSDSLSFMCMKAQHGVHHPESHQLHVPFSTPFKRKKSLEVL